MLESFWTGLESLRSPRNILMVFLTSLVIWLLETGKYWFVMHAFDFAGYTGAFFALMLMNGIVNLATTIPAAPGYVGTFDAPGIAVLSAYGVNPAVAAGYTLVLHAALWLPITLLGAVLYDAREPDVAQRAGGLRGAPGSGHLLRREVGSGTLGPVMKIAIIGAGAAGLAAAYDLTRAGHSVTIFEAAPQVGGLAAGFKAPHWEWTLEKFYHHWFATDKRHPGADRRAGLERPGACSPARSPSSTTMGGFTLSTRCSATWPCASSCATIP